MACVLSSEVSDHSLSVTSVRQNYPCTAAASLVSPDTGCGGRLGPSSRLGNSCTRILCNICTCQMKDCYSFSSPYPIISRSVPSHKTGIWTISLSSFKIWQDSRKKPDRIYEIQKVTGCNFIFSYFQPYILCISIDIYGPNSSFVVTNLIYSIVHEEYLIVSKIFFNILHNKTVESFPFHHQCGLKCGTNMSQAIYT